jgi:hypothetical protein
MKIRSDGAELFHTHKETDGPMDRWTDGPMDSWTDMTKLIVAFRNFANAQDKVKECFIRHYLFYEELCFLEGN